MFIIRVRPKILVFLIKDLNLLLGSTSKSNFWQYVNCVIIGNLIDFEKNKKYSLFFNRGLNSLLGSALVP